VTRCAALIAAGALALVDATAVGAAVFGFGPQLRAWLRFGFSHPRDLAEFAAIAAANARVAALPVLGALVVPLLGRARAALDLVVVLVAVGNCVLVGLALAAYGARLGLALAVHGPLELAGMSLALAVYLRARTAQPRRPLWLLRPVAGCAALILAAAAAEVWVS
jgi:hypothetical protein